MKRRLMGHFFKGLLVVAPVAITLFIFYKLFVLIDQPLSNQMQKHFHLTIPGLGFLITIILATGVLILVGFLSSKLLFRGLVEFVDGLFSRWPLVKLIHSALKDLIGAFVGEKKRFDQPVLVTLIPQGDVRAVGFVTRKSLENLGLTEHVAVYLPQSYNFAGQLLLVPRAQVTPLSGVSSSELMAFIVSGGISGGDPKAIEEKK